LIKESVRDVDVALTGCIPASIKKKLKLKGSIEVNTWKEDRNECVAKNA